MRGGAERECDLLARQVAHAFHAQCRIGIELVLVDVGEGEDHAEALHREVLDHARACQGCVEPAAGQRLVDLRSVVEFDQFEIDAAVAEVVFADAVEQRHVDQLDMDIADAHLSGCGCRQGQQRRADDQKREQGAARSAENLHEVSPMDLKKNDRCTRRGRASHVVQGQLFLIDRAIDDFLDLAPQVDQTRAETRRPVPLAAQRDLDDLGDA